MKVIKHILTPSESPRLTPPEHSLLSRLFTLTFNCFLNERGDDSRGRLVIREIQGSSPQDKYPCSWRVLEQDAPLLPGLPGCSRPSVIWKRCNVWRITLYLSFCLKKNSCSVTCFLHHTVNTHTRWIYILSSSHWSLVACRPCECDPGGTVDHCSPLDGRCLCKTNVEGHGCDRCVCTVVACVLRLTHMNHWLSRQPEPEELKQLL